MRTIAPAAALLLAATAFGSETVIEVPQGSGVFPTVGQVDCLEEVGSGRFCAATYECADESGDLWGDLANHDGRRAIGVDSPVARERGCTITVDGKAAARWFVGFSPDGRNGELVGVTAKHDAEPPVIRRVATASGEGSGSFLSWFVERYEIEDVIGETRDAICGHIVVDTVHYDNCLKYSFTPAVSQVARAMSWENTPLARCAAELAVAYDAKLAADSQDREPESPVTMLRGSSCQASTGGSTNICVVLATIAAYVFHDAYDEPLPGRFAECRTLFDRQWSDMGFDPLPSYGVRHRSGDAGASIEGFGEPR